MAKRLLVVDDQPALGEIVRRTAEGLDYEVVVTTHAEEFMAEYESFDPTAIVLDIVMPDIDGIELVGWSNESAALASSSPPDTTSAMRRWRKRLAPRRGWKSSSLKSRFGLPNFATHSHP